MLCGRRLGFSGTPSDLLPLELGKCNYEKGSDGKMGYVLTSPTFVSAYHVVSPGWSASSVLDMICHPPPGVRYHSLIDTGAIITGMTNVEVAQYLLTHGLGEKI